MRDDGGYGKRDDLLVGRPLRGGSYRSNFSKEPHVERTARVS
jgi:hypothetical protein